MPTIWGNVEDNTYTLSQTLSISFLSSASTLALINFSAYLLIFKEKSTLLSRLIIAFLAAWWIGSSLDYVFDLLLAADKPDIARIHGVIEQSVVRGLYSLSTELFNWSIFKLFSTVSSDFRASFRFARAIVCMMVLEALFAIATYSVSLHHAIYPYPQRYIQYMYVILYLVSILVSLTQTAYFIYTHYCTCTNLPFSLESSLKWGFSSGLAYLLLQSLIQIFFAVATVTSHASLYDVRVSVLSCSLRYSLFLLFLYRVNRNSMQPVILVAEKLHSVEPLPEGIIETKIPRDLAGSLGNSLKILEGSSKGSDFLYDLYGQHQSTF